MKRHSQTLRHRNDACQAERRLQRLQLLVRLHFVAVEQYCREVERHGGRVRFGVSDAQRKALETRRRLARCVGYQSCYRSRKANVPQAAR